MTSRTPDTDPEKRAAAVQHLEYEIGPEEAAELLAGRHGPGAIRHIIDQREAYGPTHRLNFGTMIRPGNDGYIAGLERARKTRDLQREARQEDDRRAPQTVDGKPLHTVGAFSLQHAMHGLIGRE